MSDRNTYVFDIEELSRQAVLLQKDLFVLQQLFETENHMDEALRLERNVVRWVGRNAANSIGVRIRRLIDTQSRTISLSNLLYFLKDNPELLRIQNCFPDYEKAASDLKSQWDLAYAVRMGGDASIEGKRRKLKSLMKQLPTKSKLIEFINREIAHRARAEMEERPKYSEIITAGNSVIEVISLLKDILHYYPVQMPRPYPRNFFLV